MSSDLSAAGEGLLGSILLLSGIAVAPVAAWALRRLHPGRNIVFARHGFSHVVVAVACVLVGSLLGSLVATPLRGAEGEPSILADLVAGAVAFACGVGYIVAVQVRLDPDGWRALGLRGDCHHGTAVLGGLGVWLIALPAIFGLGWIWSWLSSTFDLGDPAQEIAKRFMALPEGQRFWPLVFGIAIVPLLEEILFRAFLQPLLVQNLRERAGIAVTAIVFGALHGPAAFLQVTGLAIVLGAVMLRTQSLFAVWAMHAAHNGLMFWLMYSVPEVRRWMGAE